MSRRVWLSLGSNLGDRWAYLGAAVSALRAHPEIVGLRCSDVFETMPVGGPQQPEYLNLVVEFRTGISAQDLLAFAQRLEAAAGRVRDEHWGPRTLDVDIIAIDGEQHERPDLVVPHPRAAQRAFVVMPLAQLADPAQVLGPAAAVTATSAAAGVRRLESPLPDQGRGGGWVP